MTPPNVGAACARCIVDELARGGIRHVVISPGSRSAPLAYAFDRDPRVAVHVVVDERSAGYVALGIGRASGSPAAVVCTSGTAAANLLPAVVEASLARVPLVVLTADRPPELRDTGAPQTIDQTHLFGRFPRWFFDLGPPESRHSSVRMWRSVAARAVAEATMVPAGPVHLNCPFRDPLAPVEDGSWDGDIDGRPDEAPWSAVAPIGADAAAAARALLEVTAARSGVVVAAGPVDDPEAVVRFAGAVGWPLLADPLSGARWGDNAVRSYEALLRVQAWADDHVPDVVVRIGNGSTSQALAAVVARARRHVLVDAGATLLDPGRTVTDVLGADPGPALRRAAREVGAAASSAWLSEWRDGDAAASVAIDEILDDTHEPSEPAVARDVAAALPPNAVLVVGSSMPVRDLEWFMRPRRDLRVLGNRGANGIDGFTSSVAGIAVGSGEHTVAICGDLALLHDRGGLAAARAVELAPVVIVLNNGGGAIFSFLPHADYPDSFERLFATPHDTDLAALAAADGWDYVLVTTPSGVTNAVAPDGSRPLLAEVRTERAANVALHQALWDAARAAIG